ncbi:MAG TPA: ATP-binding protein [Verrucomicrobiae bacterium]|jgi:signal transduction histidine kinase
MNSDAVFELPAANWPMFLANAAGEILLVNAAAVRIFGSSLQTETVPLAKIWLPENGLGAEQLLSDLEKIPPAAALKFRAQDGSTPVFSVSVCPFKSGEEKYFIFQLFPAPPPEVKKPADAPPPEMKRQADEANLAQKQKLDCALRLARTVSLDFNNALTSILGHTSLLLSKAEPGHPWRRSLMEVEKSAARAAEIANELAIFSQQEKETRLQPPGNLNAVAQRCVEFFRNSPGAKITWKVQLERELFGARFDEAKMQQALTKILENAVEALAGGDGQVVVQTRNVVLTEPTQDRTVHLAAGTYVSVEIADNGGGIAPEVLPRIFEPFFTTKKPPHRGLGLALVYGIVANHGGGVAVSSQPGAGASARIYLPAEKQFVRESDGAGDDLHGTETVLVVDDESLLLTMSEMILTDYGYRVLTASNGQKALAILSRDDTKVDLVVTDMVMPGMGGRELVEHIRQLAPGTRILCTSGFAVPADKQAGAMYLQKPFTSAELLSKVKRALISETSVD